AGVPDYYERVLRRIRSLKRRRIERNHSFRNKFDTWRSILLNQEQATQSGKSVWARCAGKSATVWRVHRRTNPERSDFLVRCGGRPSSLDAAEDPFRRGGLDCGRGDGKHPAGLRLVAFRG